MPIIQDPKPLNLSSLLAKSKLEVPKFQRSYSWLKEHVEEFLNDLFGAFSKEEPWFLGILYTFPKDENDPPDLRMLLDGQQRITTIFILLKELMLFHENAPTDSQLKRDLEVKAASDLKSILFLPAQTTPRLQLDIANKDKFAEYLQGQAWRDSEIRYQEGSDVFAASHRLLNSAVTAIRNRLSQFYADIPETMVAAKFDLLIKFVLLNIELVEIQVSDNETIYRIFENINDRGLHLSDSDKFKNLYCSLLTPTEIGAFEEKWFNLNRSVNSIGLELDKDFFFFYYRSKGIDDAGKFYKTLRERVGRKVSHEEKLAEVRNTFLEIQDMVKVAKAVINVKLSQVFEANLGDTQRQISKVVSVIVRMAWRTSPQFRVLVYSVFFAFRDRRDIDGYTQFLTNLMNAVRFYVSSALLGTKGNAIRPFTIDIAGQLQNGVSVATAVRSKESLNFPNRFTDKRLDRLSFSDNNLSSLCILLVQANRNVEPIRAHDADQSWSLEHFVPKKFEDHWNHLADENFKKFHRKYNIRDDVQVDDLRKKNKHRIQEFLGNKFYIGLGQNKLANNKSFEAKRQQYIDFGHPITMPNFLPFRSWEAYSSFGVKDILVRTNELYDILIRELKTVDLPNLNPS